MELLTEKSIPTLCLNMIVKNEGKIIIRLLESVSKIIDCYCICDTGSTDNTCELITSYFEEKKIPGKIIYEPFVNFAHNRNVALDGCQQMVADYILLLDADMFLDIKIFDKKILHYGDSFCILQGNDNFFYYNKRIVKNNGLYKYIGVTHEYMDVPPNNKTINIEKSILFIYDIGDGGSKNDKFERDILLLSKGIEENPTNERYHFYLANSYADIQNNEKAIEMYKKRIELKGWCQEVWYSYYKIGLLYKRMGKPADAIFYWLAGYDYFPDRIENLYEIINYYRIVGNCKAAMVFYNLAKTILDKKLNWDTYLFLQNDIYTYKLEYEYSIIACYNNVKNIDKQIICIMNNTDDQSIRNNVLSNMKFYKNILIPIKKINMNSSLYQSINNVDILFKSSSACIIPNKNMDGYIMNMRFVNYNIDALGNYLDCDKHIITLNKYIELNKDFNIISEKMLDTNYVDRRYIGIEDVKIFLKDDTDLLFIGTGYHSNNTLGIVIGNYDINNILEPIEIKSSFCITACEKNWVYVNIKKSLHVVYNWFPVQLCKIDDAKKSLELIKSVEMPRIFKNVRGSTNGFTYNNEIWFLGHIVNYGNPRYYYHIFSIFNEDMTLLRYSAPFNFDKECVEFCLGLIVEDETIICTYSTWDKTTNIVLYDKNYINSLICNKYK
jgi:tetratricopeptide (TPR) repeat protein